VKGLPARVEERRQAHCSVGESASTRRSSIGRTRQQDLQQRTVGATSAMTQKLLRVAPIPITERF
jgi:hypothetical protein